MLWSSCCNLFELLGNEHDAADRSLLKKHGINNVLNVTSHVPCYFESDGVTYVRFAAADSGTENLRQYFEDAIQFIGQQTLLFYILR